MSENKKNEDGKKSLSARLLKPEFVTAISAVIVAIGGILAIVWPDVAKHIFPAPAPTASPNATETPVPSSPMQSPEPSPVPPTPTCVRAVDSLLSAEWDRGKLGCPTSEAVVVWAAWQPFEHGYMLWRSDTERVTVFYDDRSWAEFSDQWVEGEAYPSRGSPEPGLLAPSRGFGYIWSTNNEVFDRLGWALAEEEGFCAKIQRFENGLILGTRAMLSCQEQGHTWTTDPSFPGLLFAVYDDHGWHGEQI
jgi:hypothetical protein